MNSPAQNRGHLPQYRSQVATLTTSKSPVLVKQNNNNFKQSLVPDLTKKYHELQKKQSVYNLVRKQDELFSERNYVKGYEHLLPSKSKNSIKSPLNTYRTRQNLSPRSPRDNIYISDNDTELESNRSVKFISKLREQINSPLRKYQSPINLNINFKQKGSPSQNYPKRQAQTVIQSRVKQQGSYSPQIISHEKMQRLQQSEDNLEFSQSPQRETFQRKLIDKCKSLQFQLQSKQKQINRITHKLQTLEHKHVSEMNLLKNQFLLQKSKKESQLQITTKQIQQLEKSIRNIQRSKNIKQKALTEQVSRYARELKQSQQQRNKMVLQFQTILKQKVESKQKLCSDQVKNDFAKIMEENKSLRKQVNDFNKEIQSIKQERQDIFQQSKLLNLELQNYTKWNQQQSQQIRVYERKLHQLEASTKLYHKQKQYYETTIEQLQQTLTGHKNTVKSMQAAQFQLSQQVQILRFEAQSLKNQKESKQKQFLREKSIYVQEIQILDSKYLSANKEKLQICEELDYQRKELANMRRLVDSLEERLEEQRRDFQQVDISKDRYCLQHKETSQALSKLRQQMIYKDNELQIYSKKLQQLQEQAKLAKMQKSNNTQILPRRQILQTQQPSQNSNTTQCLQRIQLLQKQLNQLMGRFKQEKLLMIKNYQKEKQSLMKRIIQVERQLFRKQEACLDDRKRYGLQSARHEQKIIALQHQLSNKTKQLKQSQQQLNVRQIKVKHLIKKVEQIQSSYQKKLNSKQEQLADVKRVLTDQKHRQLQLLFQMIQNTFAQIESSLNPKQKHTLQSQIQQQKQNIISATSFAQENHITSQTNPLKQEQMVNSTSAVLNKQKTPEKRQSSPNKRTELKSTTKKLSFTNYLKQFNEHQLSISFISRTKQMTSFINLLNKKVSLYEFTIGSLESSIQSQPVKIHQQYMQKIAELEKKLEIQQNLMEMKKQSFSKELIEQKQCLIKDLQRIKKDLSQKNKQIQELTKMIQLNKKARYQLEQKVEFIEKQNKKVVKKLTSDIQEYKNIYNLLKEQKQHIQKQSHQKQSQALFLQLQQKGHNSNEFNPSNMYNEQNSPPRNNISSMTTVNRQNQYPTISNLNLTKTPIKTIRQNINDTSVGNSSLQQIVEHRLNQLTLQNDHLSSQLSSVNNQLMKQKEMFIELNYVIKQLEKEIEKVSSQNQRMKQHYYHFELKQKQICQQLAFLQQHNAQLQVQIQSHSKIIQQTSTKLQQTKAILHQSQKSKKQLQRHLQNFNNQEAQKYCDLKKLKDQAVIKQSQLQMLRLQKDTQINNLSKAIRQSEHLLKQEVQKRKILQKVYEQLLRSIEKLPFSQNLKRDIYHNQSLPKISQSNKNFSIQLSTLNQYQRQTVSSLATSFTSKLQNLHHTIQQFQTINQSLRTQIQRQKSTTDQKHLQVMKKERQLQISKDKLSALERTIQRLQIQIQEWKFICQSNSLNKSLTLEQKWMKQSMANRGKYHQSTFTKPACNSQNVHYPQKGTSTSQSKRSPSPLKSPPKLNAYQQPHLSTNRQHQNNYQNTKTHQHQSYQTNLQNSVESISSVGQFYEYQKGKNFCNSSGEMSFF